MSSVPPSGSWSQSFPELPELPEGVVPSTPPPPAPNVDAGTGEVLPRWAPWTAWLALLAGFVGTLFGAVLIGVVAAAFGASFSDPPPAVNIAATIVQDGAFVTAALLLARRAGPLLPAEFGLRRTALWQALGWIALALLAFYVFSGAWAALVNVNQKDTLPQDLGVHDSTAALVAVCVLVTVIAPMAEELFFRGFFFGALRNWHGLWPAAIVTGLVFGGIHVGSAPVQFLPPLAFLGFVLCLLRWRTGSLLPCMAVHALNNSIAFAVNEASWNASQAILLILGSNAVILLVCLPLLRTRRTAIPA
jgi:membrane protease YdiL (CAAX protease family)